MLNDWVSFAAVKLVNERMSSMMQEVRNFMDNNPEAGNNFPPPSPKYNRERVQRLPH